MRSSNDSKGSSPYDRINSSKGTKPKGSNDHGLNARNSNYLTQDFQYSTRRSARQPPQKPAYPSQISTHRDPLNFASHRSRDGAEGVDPDRAVLSSGHHQYRHQRRDSNAPSSAVQQQQIEDLEKKVDIILMHNEKLTDENERLKLMIEDLHHERTNSHRQASSNTARFAAEESEILINKLRKELQMACDGYELKLSDAYEAKQILQQEIQTLSKIIGDMGLENQSMKSQIHEQNLREEQLTFKLKEEYIRQQQEHQAKLKDEFLIKEVQFEREKQKIHQKYLQELESQKTALEKQKEALVKEFEEKMKKLEQVNREQKKELKQKCAKDQQAERVKLVAQKQKELEAEKEIGRKYVRQFLDGVQENNQNDKQEYEDQIKKLKDSLGARKLLIERLLKDSSSNLPAIDQEEDQQRLSKDNSWYEELLRLKSQLREVTNSFLRDSELLKLKMTEKHQMDIEEMRRVYEDKIELMSTHVDTVDDQNTRLRDLYEKSLHQKIEQKKSFELQVSKLKSFIRKLKVELQGVQEQFRLNIDGVKDQNNTFSMTMMKSVMEVKQKANFYQQQNRKLRQAYEEHEKQVAQEKKQCSDKVAYYEDKYEALHEKLKAVVEDYSSQLIRTQQQAEERQNSLRDNLNQEHEMIQTMVEELRQESLKLQAEIKQLKKQNHELVCENKEKKEDIEFFKSKADQLEADIERLKMDLEMAGVNDKDKVDTINQWKQHYEKQIGDMDYEIEVLKGKLQQKEEQLIEVVKRYNALELQLERTMKSLKKRSTVESKVLELGIDLNLVKNMKELFGSREPMSELTGRDNLQDSFTQ